VPAGETLFISDLHLDPSRPAVTDRFFALLRSDRAQRALAIYILGDLFEAWLGDDDPTPAVGRIVAELRALRDAGTPLYFMHGNRDFLVGQRFAAESGCELLEEPAVIDLYGEQTLLMHGDSLCTDDTEYQSFRAMVRDPAWQARMLALPFEQRIELAKHARQESRNQTRAKDMQIMDVNPGAVARVMRELEVRLLIHGHTHRPGIHDFELDGRPARRIVLPDWYDKGGLLACAPGVQRLEEV
jgi:UDP-2,3-diacylglucosamine hydrolase